MQICTSVLVDTLLFCFARKEAWSSQGQDKSENPESGQLESSHWSL